MHHIINSDDLFILNPELWNVVMTVLEKKIERRSGSAKHVTVLPTLVRTIFCQINPNKYSASQNTFSYRGQSYWVFLTILDAQWVGKIS
jgi:membrane-anchored protein YejM (alkaline phosphatase superfamily)